MKLATDVDRFTTTAATFFDVAHKDDGLTFDVDTAHGLKRFVIPWADYPRFIAACAKAALYCRGEPAAINLALDVLECTESNNQDRSGKQ